MDYLCEKCSHKGVCKYQEKCEQIVLTDLKTGVEPPFTISLSCSFYEQKNEYFYRNLAASASSALANATEVLI